MKYIKVKWKHSNPNYPVLLFSEVDNARWETRKVEVFVDGKRGFAGSGESTGQTILGLEPVPPLEEIAKDPEFEPCEITKEEFEAVWSLNRAKAG